MTRLGELACWTGAALLAAGGFAMRVGTTSGAPNVARQPATLPVLARTGSIAATASIVARDPFRLDRRPSPIAFDPAPRPVATVATVVGPPKPALVLRAVVGGPPWEALIEGLPGRTGGALVRAGEKIGALSIASISRDLVVVTGMDTTWRLGVMRPWR